MAVTHTLVERIGIDGSGKSDDVGPLVIAAVFVDAVTQHELALIQVHDSKKISDGRILEMAPDIKAICPHSGVAVDLQKCNKLYAKIKNLNRLRPGGMPAPRKTCSTRCRAGAQLPINSETSG